MVLETPSYLTHRSSEEVSYIRVPRRSFTLSGVAYGLLFLKGRFHHVKSPKVKENNKNLEPLTSPSDLGRKRGTETKGIEGSDYSRGS